jgi:hypothetical protein
MADDVPLPSCRRPLLATTSLPRPPVILMKSDAVPGAPGDSDFSWPPAATLVAGIGTGALDNAVVQLSTRPRCSSELLLVV